MGGLSDDDALAVHAALHDPTADSALALGRRWRIETHPNGYRRCTVFGCQFATQNPRKASPWSRRAAEGHQITWIMCVPEPWGLIEDGAVVRRCNVLRGDEGAAATVAVGEEDVAMGQPPLPKRPRSSPALPDDASAGACDGSAVSERDYTAEASRPMCKYAGRCYRTSRQHFSEFRHPAELVRKVSAAAIAAAKAPSPPRDPGCPRRPPDAPAPAQGEAPAPPVAAGRAKDEAADSALRDTEMPQPPQGLQQQQQQQQGQLGQQGQEEAGHGRAAAEAPEETQVVEQEPVAIDNHVGVTEIMMGEKIGSGAFGEVRKGVWRGRVVAVKTLHQQKEKAQHMFAREADLLCKLRHPNIVECLGACTEVPYMCIVMEYLPRGLHKAIKEGPMALGRLLRIARGIADGVFFLHDLDPVVIHRDLKPENILLDDDDTPKIVDFGISREKAEDMAMTKIGTPLYCAPEVIQGKLYDEKVDIYSLGMVLYSMAAGRRPYADLVEGGQPLPPFKIMSAVCGGTRPALPDGCNAHLARLIQQCWEVEELTGKDLKQFQRLLPSHFQMHHEDYNEARIKQNKAPLTFIALRAWRVHNATLESWFEARRAFMRDALGRSEDDDELEERVAFHGTREENIADICAHGLLRVGHPLNPSSSTDPGYFGDPRCGVYTSRFVEYTLQYSNTIPAADGSTIPTPLGEVLILLLVLTLIANAAFVPAL
eukprot:m51a1_g4469 putative serine threonine kinase (712) ;mRNA; f:233437-239200